MAGKAKSIEHNFEGADANGVVNARVVRKDQLRNADVPVGLISAAMRPNHFLDLLEVLLTLAVALRMA